MNIPHGTISEPGTTAPTIADKPNQANPIAPVPSFPAIENRKSKVENLDLAEFLMLPAAVREEVEAWDTRLALVTRPRQRSLATLAARMGVSKSTARRKYDLWRTEGWRGLINRAKAPELRASNLSREFLEYWKTLCEQNGRKCLPAYRQFLREFKSGSPIPGLPPEADRATLPEGFTYCNLVRHKPTPLELAASRVGRSVAAPFRPKIFTTRVGLSVGQRYLWDDLWHDFKLVQVGNRRPCRLLQLHAHDLFSGCQFARGLKARTEDPETGKSVNLRADEMLFLLAHVFTEFGWHPDGCTQMVEHGTAAISELIEQLLFDLSGGKILVDRSGIEGASAFAGQYPGRGKGNFRFKAALESLGNLIHNETANLLQFPGQTGSNSRLNLPEELHGRERLTDQLSLAMTALPSHVAIQLRLPFLEANLAKWLVEEVMERINQRTAHELEGWLEAGLTTVDFHVPGVGLISGARYLELSADKQAAIAAAGTPTARKLSPREVFNLGRPNLVKFRPEESATLLLKALSSGHAVADREPHTVRVGQDHLITFEDQNISPSPLRYLAHHFSPGDTFRPVVNPWSPDTLHLFDARERWVGVVKAWQTISQDDPAALAAQMGHAARVEKELLAPLVARGRDLVQKRLADTQHNTRVLKSDQRANADAESQARASFLESSI